MNLPKLLTREEPIAGLDIREDELHLLYLDFNRRTGAISVKTMKSVAVPPGIIVDGRVKDKGVFPELLKNIVREAKFGLKYFIVSIPANQAYYKVYSFPKSVTQEKLDDAMKLTVDFQLPFKENEMYYDWEKFTDGGTEKEMVRIPFAAIRKDVVDDYIDCLNKAGIKTVALEIHPLSVIRVLDISDDTHLVQQKNPSNCVFFSIKQRMVDFLRSIPKEYVAEEELRMEEMKMINYYQEKGDSIKQHILFDHIAIDPHLLLNKDIGCNQGKWAVALGVALRAKLPRKEDDLISIMPLGTEKAYEYQRAASFLSFITNTIVGLAIFFSLSYVASFILMISLQSNFTQRVNNLSSLAAPADAGELEKRAQEFNELVGKTSVAVRTMPQWSIFLETFFDEISKDIILSSLSLPSPEEKLGITGTAKNRTALNNFRKRLHEWPLIAGVEFPITDLETKENIPFRVSFVLRNPQELYNWK